MRPQRVWIALAVLGFAVLVCACGPSAQPRQTPQPTALAASEPTPTRTDMETLDPSDSEVHLWHSMTGAKEQALLNIARGYERSNPYGIRVRVEFHSALHKEILASVSAGTPPDIVVAPCQRVAEYAVAGWVVPLGEYVESARYGLTALERLDLQPTSLGGCLSASTNQALGLVFDTQMVVMYYNADWLRELGADSPPRTWEAFRALCNDARDMDAGTWGYSIPVDGSLLLNWILGLGGSPIDTNSRQALLDSPVSVASLSVLRDTVQDDCGFCLFGSLSEGADWKSGEVLFSFGTTAELPGHAAEPPGFDWDIAPVPHLTVEPVLSAQGSTLGILRSTPRQQLAAWLLLKWLMRPLNDAQWVLASGSLPMLRSTRYFPEIETYLEALPQFSTACDLLPYALPEPSLPEWPEIRALLAGAAEIICQQQIDPVKALAPADGAADRLLAQ